MDGRHPIHIVGNDACCNCLCHLLNGLDHAVYDPTKINPGMSSKKLLMKTEAIVQMTLGSTVSAKQEDNCFLRHQ